MRILMLGWELPPLITGGLGVACNGFLESLPDNARCKITFVLPTAKLCRSYPGVTVLGVDEYMFQAARQVQPEPGENSKHVGAYSAEDPHIKATIEKYLKVIADLVKKEDFDLIHAHDWLTVPAGIIAKRLTGSPLVFHVHSLEQDRSPSRVNSFARSIEEEGLRAADQIIAVSEWTKARISSLYGIEEHCVDVVYNGVEQRGALLRRENRDKPIVGFLGRITAQKSPKIFVQVASELVKAGLEFNFRMAGTGDLFAAVKSLVKAYGMEERLSFDGFLPQNKVTAWLSGIDILVVPSVYEPFGIVALEAVQAHVAVVINREAGVCEVLDNVIKVSHDVKAYTDAVRHLSDTVLRHRMVREAKLEISHITWARAADRLFDIYKKQLAMNIC